MKALIDKVMAGYGTDRVHKAVICDIVKKDGQVRYKLKCKTMFIFSVRTFSSQSFEQETM